ncbi:MAG: hypothetical protein ACRENN_04205 [Candidatus Eiseniibacteriota bacterium]
MSACYFCHGSLEPKTRIVRDSTCPHCQRDLHACVQCRHYDPHAHNKCREPNAEWVSERERRNFCDYFTLNSAAATGVKTDRVQAARSKLDSLFKPKEPDPD